MDKDLTTGNVEKWQSTCKRWSMVCPTMKSTKKTIWQPNHYRAKQNQQRRRIGGTTGGRRLSLQNRMSRKTMKPKNTSYKLNLLKLQNGSKIGAKNRHHLWRSDAAGKGGTIKRFMEHLTCAVPKSVPWKPTEQEAGQWYFQRYVQHLPTKGEIVLFDRSWYNRAGVERVMGFCTEEQYNDFMRQVPEFENIWLARYSFNHLLVSVSREEQRRRFAEREAPSAQTMETLKHDPSLTKWMITPLPKKPCSLIPTV